MHTLRLLPVMLLGACLYTDLLWKKIPNYITLTGAFLGLWLHGTGTGPDTGAAFALRGMFTGLGVLIIPFILGGTGGGDVKLFGALGALVGPCAVISVFIYTAVIGGTFSFVLLVKKKKMTAVKEVVYDISMVFFNRGNKIATQKAGYIPWSVPTAFGYLVYVLIGGVI